MSTDQNVLDIAGQRVEVVRKNIKNLHLAVYPPNGHIRVAAPRRVTDDAIRLVVATRIGWIRQRQRAFTSQERQPARELISGETHFVEGRRYRLDVVEDVGTAVRVRSRRLELRVKPGTDRASRRAALDRWYRERLRARVTKLIDVWLPAIGGDLQGWGIKDMKTRWGSCSHTTRRICVNLELAKKDVVCTEYVVVHELVHLLERSHGPRFVARMDHLLPDWRLRREQLNRSPLAHEDWKY